MKIAKMMKCGAMKRYGVHGFSPIRRRTSLRVDRPIRRPPWSFFRKKAPAVSSVIASLQISGSGRPGDGRSRPGSPSDCRGSEPVLGLVLLEDLRVERCGRVERLLRVGPV